MDAEISEEGNIWIDYKVSWRGQSVSQVVGFIKGKSAIYIARNIIEHPKNFIGQNFWARWYYGTTTFEMENLSGNISGNRKKRIRDLTS